MHLTPGGRSTYEHAEDDDAKFAQCSDVYKTKEYNTFYKNGCLKLTEIEVYFLSRYVTRATAKDWGLVYLGIGNGERFRWIRDEFFPGLASVCYDPIDAFYIGDIDTIKGNAKHWTEDGTDFTFHVSCFNGTEAELADIKRRLGDRKLLLISDIRGVNMQEDGRNFDKVLDQDLQWNAIKLLNPVASLVKFTNPDPSQEYFEYAPGMVLKQIFSYYGSHELRLLVEGVPKEFVRYDTNELYYKASFHHQSMRGQVYETRHAPPKLGCFDSCFDCAVLWDTLCEYADKNGADAASLLDKIVKYHVYTPSHGAYRAAEWDAYVWQPPPRSELWRDVVWCLASGHVSPAVAALELGCADDADAWDWARLHEDLRESQPELAHRIRCAVPKPATRADVARVLGGLSEPFTIVRSYLNNLQMDPDYKYAAGRGERLAGAEGKDESEPSTSASENTELVEPAEKKQRS